MKKALTAAIFAAALTATASATQLYVVTGTGNNQHEKAYDGISVFSLDNPDDFRMVYDDWQACDDNNWTDWYMKHTSLYYYGGPGKIMGYYPRRAVVSGGFYYYEHISWLNYEKDGDTFRRSLFADKSIPGGPGTDESAFPNMLSYNPANGKIYGTNIRFSYSGSGEMTGYSTSVCEIDPLTGVRGEEVANIASQSFNSFTTDARGVMYVTDTSGNLYTLDLNAGGQTRLLGNIDVYSNPTMWSCFDYSTGLLYLMKDYTVYEINVETVTKVRAINVPVPANVAVRGLICLEEAEPVEHTVTAPPTDLSVSYDAAGSTNARISVKAPQFYLDGTTPLSGKVTLKFFSDSDTEPFATRNDIAAGETVTVSRAFTDGGQHSIIVIAANDMGDSAPASTLTWAGFDYPVAPSDVVLTISDNGDYTATWTLPSTGTHGAPVDMSTLRYTTELRPAGIVVENLTTPSVTGHIDRTDYTGYTLAVKAIAAGLESEEAVSSAVTYGQPLETAWYNDFTDPTTFDTFTVIDGNNDGFFWKFNPYFNVNCVQINGWDAKIPMDEWLLTPPIKARKGTTYTLTFTAFGGIDEDNKNSMEIYAGQTSDVSAMTKISSSDNEVIATYPGNGPVSLEYKAAEDGMVRFAFHGVSPAGCTIVLTSAGVTSEIVTGAPAAANDLTVTPADKGALSAYVSFSAPVTDNTGARLQSLSQVRVLRNGDARPVKVFDKVSPGQLLDFDDTVDHIGSYSYTIRAYNGAGVGEDASADAWIGEDLAERVGDLRIEDLGDRLAVSWTKPAAGLHNGYIDFSKMTYGVLIRLDNMEDPSTFLTDIKDTSCEIKIDDLRKYAPITNPQTSLEIYVYAATSAGYGQITSDMVIFGDPYKLPFKESFSQGSLKTSPWHTLEVGYDYANGWNGFAETSSANPDPEVKSQDNDGGLIAFYQTKLPRYEERIITPLINKKDADGVAVDFYLWHNSSAQGDRLDNYITVESCIGNEYTQQGEPVYLADGDGWVCHRVYLDEVSSDVFRVALRGAALQSVPLFVDNISVDKGRKVALETVGSDSTADALVRVVSGGVEIFSARPAAYTVTTAGGTLVTAGSLASGLRHVSLVPGVYIVKAGDTVAKCLVR